MTSIEDLTPDDEAECLEAIAQYYRRLLNRLAPSSRSSQTPDLVEKEVERILKIIGIAYLGIAAPLIHPRMVQRVLDISKLMDLQGYSAEMCAAIAAEKPPEMPSADILPFPAKPG